MTILAAIALGLPQPALPTINEVRVTPPFRNGRTPVRRDAVEHEWVTTGRIDTSRWTAVRANAEGVFQGQAMAGGYAAAEFESATDRVLILEVPGSNFTWVNGRPIAGDPYSTGAVGIPVRVRAGRNQIISTGARGSLRFQFKVPSAPVFIDLRDATLPDRLTDRKEPLIAGVVVVNTTDAWQRDLRWRVGNTTVRLPAIPPLTSRKVACPVPADNEAVLLAGNQEIGRAKLPIRDRASTQPHRITFVSDIDGSVQYYAVNPAPRSRRGMPLILSLHGASVEAMGQAEAYGQKSWANLVAPTNRRPFGFDWEEIGRLDALEVLNLAKARFAPNPNRILLTGHSMGGHGTWHLSAVHTDLFAAAAPAAGWISFATYGGGVRWSGTDAVSQMLNRAANLSETLLMKNNYRDLPVYILHGDADETVPVSEARRMRQELGGIARTLQWFEEPGGSHWYDKDPAPGADSVDYRPMMDFLRAQTRPSAPSSIDFTTLNPWVSGRRGWVQVMGVDRVLLPARVKADETAAGITLATENITRLALDVAQDAKSITIDGQAIEPRTSPVPRGRVAVLERRAGGWQRADIAANITERRKSARQAGGFKDIFRHRVHFVVGTRGTAEENAWALDTARFYAETYWVRGNGAVEIMTDREYLRVRPRANALLFGNRTTNAAWGAVMGRSPLQVDRGRAAMAMENGISREFSGDFLTFVIDGRDGEFSGAAIAPTTMVGARMAVRAPVFVSGAAYPDWLILSPAMLAAPSNSPRPVGVVGAGFFDEFWRFSAADAAWDQP